MDIEKKETDVNPSDAVDALLSDSPTQEPEQEPAKVETPVPQPQQEVTAAEQTEKAPEKQAEVTVEKPVAETTQDKKYAGKYTNTFDLIEGVLEEVKALKGDKKEISSLVTEAQASGDWSKVEAKYKELQTQVVKQIQDSKKPAEVKSPEKPVEKQSEVTDLQPEEFQQLILDTTMKQIANSDLSRKFEKFGVSIPATQEALDELEIAYPTLWTQFTDTFRNLYSNNDRQAKAFLQAEKEAPSYNESQKQKTIKQIEEFAQEWKINLPAEQIEAIISEAEKSDAVYEDKNSVKFIRDEAMFEYFMAKHARNVLNQVREQTKVDSLNQGRMEAVKDLQEAKNKVPSTISTSGIPASVAQKPKDVNWGNADEAKMAGHDKIQSKIEEMLFSN